eukprot:TRINITY_DN5757_c0_g1_i1.p1 TRINITY_DN5757_c0_g1~~TRINITY_DN5757_c0_g1_i1.p1  ORF type:complete len:123 (+),score=3.01 TRINITY_DN5757_c0_g1_i1:1403-1771(+)
MTNEIKKIGNRNQLRIKRLNCNSKLIMDRPTTCGKGIPRTADYRKIIIRCKKTPKIGYLGINLSRIPHKRKTQIKVSSIGLKSRTSQALHPVARFIGLKVRFELKGCATTAVRNMDDEITEA